jgi:PST family polysaccharide transporter
MPTSNLNNAVGGVTFSTLSRLQNDIARYRNYFLKAYTLVISMTLPVTVFAAVFAEDLVLVILGPKWTDAIPIFRLLTPTILVFGMIDPLAWLLWSSGRQMRSLKIALVIAVLVITSYFVGLPYGPQGVAFAFSTAMVIWLVPHVIWCVHGTTISAWDLFRVAGRPLLAAAVAVSIAFAVQPYLGEVQLRFIRLLLEGSIMLVAYFGILLFVMGQKNFYFDLLKVIGTISSPLPDTRGVEKV